MVLESRRYGVSDGFVSALAVAVYETENCTVLEDVGCKFLRTASIFCLHLRKLMFNHTDYFEKLTVHMLHRKIRVNDGCGVSKAVTSTQDKKKDEERGKPQKNRRCGIASEGVELDEDDSQTQKQLAEQLGVSQRAVYNQQRKMGKIQKSCKWVPHELNDTQMKVRKTQATFCSLCIKGSRFCIVQLQGMKTRFILRIPSTRNHG